MTDIKLDGKSYSTQTTQPELLEVRTPHIFPEGKVNSEEGWQTVELTKPIPVEEGQTVWLSWVFENMPGVCTLDDSPNGGGRASSGQDWAYGMPTTFGSSKVSSWKYAICANYTAEDEQPLVTLIGNPYMYTARAYDIETGLYYYRARYYNPHIGRFLQVDPARDGMNWYAYCGNSPFNFTDPTGLYAEYDFNCPVSIITNLNPALIAYYQVKIGGKENNPLAKLAAQSFFSSVGFWKYDEGKYADWEITKVYYFDGLIDGKVVPSFQIFFKSDEADWGEFEIGFETAEVITDNSIWGHNDTLWSKVPYLYFTEGSENIAILNMSTIKKLIKAGIAEVDNFCTFTSTLAAVPMAYQFMRYFFLVVEWDSWFYKPRNLGSKTMSRYLYNGKDFSASDINYIVGGYTFRKLGFWHSQMNGYIYMWKNGWAVGTWILGDEYNYRSVDDLENTYFWAQKGWDMAG